MRPLTQDEQHRLLAWQRKMVTMLVVLLVGLFGLVVAFFVLGLTEFVATPAFAALLALTAYAGWLQFSEKCPRCTCRIGLHSSTLPDRCPGCHVALKYDGVEPRT